MKFSKSSEILNLQQKRKARRKENRFIVEGNKLVEEAVDYIDYVVFSENLPILEKLRSRNIPCYKISKKEFTRLSLLETPSWILAVVKTRQVDIEEILDKKGLIVLCLGIQDPGNMGTILRSADAASASGAIVSSGCVDVHNPKVVRASMGSIFHLPIVFCHDIKETVKNLKDRQYKIIGTHNKLGKVFWQLDLTERCVLLLGNEGSGIDEEYLALCNELANIPILGGAESLNVAMASTLLIYEVLRQRTKHG
jgi:TrmH family RNA methyltransferase